MSLPKLIAVDCGASRVTLAVFTKAASGGPQLDDVESVALPPTGAQDEGWPAAAADAVVGLARAKGLSGKLHLVVPGHLCLAKFIRIPQSDPAKLAKVARFEAQQNIPYPLSEVSWDFRAVGVEDGETEVAFAAVKNEVLDPLCLLLQAKGFEVARIEAPFMALANGYRMAHGAGAGMSILVSVGAKSTQLVFLDQGRLLSRSVPLAGNAVTQALADELKLPFAEADRMKREVFAGARQVGADSRELMVLDAAVRNLVARLGAEITRTLATFRRGSGESTGLVLTGGGSDLGNFGEQLGERLRMPVSVFDPAKAVTVAPQLSQEKVVAQRRLLAEVVGVAAVEYGTGMTGFDLVPAAIAKQNEFKRRKPFLLAAAACVVAALWFPAQQNLTRAAAHREATRAVNARVVPLETASRQIDERRRAVDAAVARINGIRDLVESRSNWPVFFRDLQERLVSVENVWLESLTVDRAGSSPAGSGGSLFGGQGRPPGGSEAAGGVRLVLSGRLIDKSNPQAKVSPDAENRVKDLLARFQESAFISRVEGESFDSSQPGILRFNFVLVVDPAKPL